MAEPSSTEECLLQRSRVLTEEEHLMLAKQNSKIVTDFKSMKLEKEARKMWDLFYKRNSTNFFKDRQWLTREFDEIKNISCENNKMVMLEAGCGVGNTIFPLHEQLPNLFIHACDFSHRAVDFVKENPNYNEDWCRGFECDLTSEPCGELTRNVEANSVDVATLIFVLSAIHPDKFLAVFKNLFKVLKPGGMLMFRDYGVNDWAMLRFKPGSKISDQFYVRQDGTRAYYFSTDEIGKLTERAGYDVIENDYVMRRTVNHKQEVEVPRVFVQGKFRKPT